MSQKRGNRKEFFINFFERCNLRCGFCWQNHDDWTGIDTIRDKAALVIQHASVPGNHYIVNVMGGELFMDQLPDRVLEDYLYFCEEVASKVESYEINFVTNLVFNNTSRIKAFLRQLEERKIKFGLCTSYDPAGRFNPLTLSVFTCNLALFKPWVTNVSVVLTRPNIRHFMQGKVDAIFDYIYAEHPVFFDYYSPEKNQKLLQPTDKEIVDFFLWLNEHYPNSAPIADFRENKVNATTCRSSLIILPDGSTGSCRILADRKQFKSDVAVTDNIHEAEARFIKHFDCLSCEYYTRCGLGCFLHADHISITTQTCEFKRMFKELDQ